MYYFWNYVNKFVQTYITITSFAQLYTRIPWLYRMVIIVSIRTWRQITLNIINNSLNYEHKITYELKMCNWGRRLAGRMSYGVNVLATLFLATYYTVVCVNGNERLANTRHRCINGHPAHAQISKQFPLCNNNNKYDIKWVSFYI